MPKNITEENVDEYIEDLRSRTKGQYITQGVSFNKNCKRQLSLLKKALLESTSFSGLAKEMLALRYNGEGGTGYVIPVPQEQPVPPKPIVLAEREPQVLKAKSNIVSQSEESDVPTRKQSASGWI